MTYHFTAIREILSKILNVITAEKTNEKREANVLLIGMYIGIDLVTNTWDVSQKSKKRTFITYNYIIAGSVPRRNEINILMRHLYLHIYYSIVDDS